MALVIKLYREPNGKLPTRGKHGDAGLDCYADLQDGLVLRTGQAAKIPLGFRYALEWLDYGSDRSSTTTHFYLEVANRSGFGTKEMVTELARICDSSYRGVPHYSIAKVGGEDTIIFHHQKICQILVHPFVDPSDIILQEVSSIEELGSTDRGSGGFNSSGSF